MAIEPVLKRYAVEKNPGLASDEQMRAVEDRLSEPAESEAWLHELEGGHRALYFVNSAPSQYLSEPGAARLSSTSSSAITELGTDIRQLQSPCAELPGQAEKYEMADTSLPRKVYELPTSTESRTERDRGRRDS
jgi:hypothetical protein